MFSFVCLLLLFLKILVEVVCLVILVSIDCNYFCKCFMRYTLARKPISYSLFVVHVVSVCALIKIWTHKEQVGYVRTPKLYKRIVAKHITN